MTFFRSVPKLFFQLLIALCLTSTFSHAKDTWSEPSQVSFLNSNQLDISVDPSGKAFGIWQSFDGASHVIETSHLNNDGYWSEPTTLSEEGKNALSPKIVVDAFGYALSIWSEFDGEHFIIQSSTLIPCGNWSKPVTLSTPGENALYPVLAASTIGQGTAIAAWSRYNGSHDVVQSSFHSKLNWSLPTDLSTTKENAMISQVAINPRSHAIATYSNLKVDNNETTAFANYFDGEKWIISSLPDGAKDDTSIALDRKGNAVAVWSKYHQSTNRIVIYASFLRNGKTWSTPRLLSDPSQNALNPKVRMSENGHTIVIWMGSQADNEEASIFAYAVKAKFNQWEAPIKLSSNNQKVCEVDLAVDPIGQTVVVWTAYSDKFTSVIQATTSNQKGKWSKPINISKKGKVASNPVVGVDRLGNGVLLWIEGDPASDVAGQADAKVWGATLLR